MTKGRLQSFKFVGPMLKGPIGILAKKTNGFTINSQQELINPDSLVMMLELDRLSAITLEYTSAMWKMGQLSIDTSKYEFIHTIAEIPVGFGFNRKIDPRILATLQTALDEIISDGTLEKIYYKYQTNREQSGLQPTQ